MRAKIFFILNGAPTYNNKQIMLLIECHTPGTGVAIWVTASIQLII